MAKILKKSLFIGNLASTKPSQGLLKGLVSDKINLCLNI